MRSRRSHYELAFEAYLDRRGTPYVAVESVRDLTRSGTGVKGFDYIVYPSGCTACLVDLKGRKSTGSGAEPREKTWVTQADAEGLAIWQEIFGDEYVAAFVFAYCKVGGRKAGGDATVGPSGEFVFAGRSYSFWRVLLTDYVRHQRPLSKRWKTVSVPREAFRSISVGVGEVWPAAPC